MKKKFIGLLVPFLVAFTTLAQGPTHYGTPTTGNSQTSVQTITSHTVGTASNRVLIVCVSCINDAGETISTITWNTSESLTFIRADEVGNSERLEIWRLAAPTETTANVVVTWTDTIGEANAAALNYQDVDQSTPVEADNGTNGTDTAASTGITTINANALLVDCAAIHDGGSAAAPGTGQTERTDTDSGFTVTAVSDEAAPTAGGYTQTYSWTGSVDYGHAVIALKSATTPIKVEGLGGVEFLGGVEIP